MPRLTDRLRRLAPGMLLLVAGTTLASPVGPARWDMPGAGNPLLPGYFADPSIVRDDAGRWYIFATIDPWGDDRLGLWTSDNGRDWRFSTPDWPTKQAASSPTSGNAKVWAPSVVRAADGRWFMYVSVGSEIWVGTAPSPAGPWRDAHGGTPLIARDAAPDYHMIDGEAFVDDDGQAYLYWGSGLNWTNGHCFVVKLKPDMVSFDGTPRDVTPPNYFEAPFMVKSKGRYLLTYSDGNTTKDSYKVRYAIGATPFGPFREAANIPILQTDTARQVISPGHHAVFRSQGRSYILYHRQALPWPKPGNTVLRQVAVDRLAVTADGNLARVRPTHRAPVGGFAAGRDGGMPWRPVGDVANASRAADDNYGTLWRATVGNGGTLTADLGSARRVSGSRLRPEHAARDYRYAVDASRDGRTWTRVHAAGDRSGSPVTIAHPTVARYLRLTVATANAGLWEWSID